MTATTYSTARLRPGAIVRPLIAGPAEGWLTLAAVAIMVLSIAWSIDDAKWVRGVGSLTDFLPMVGSAGVAVGFTGAKLGWGRWTTHLIGVAFAAIILPIIAGGIVLGDAVQGLGVAALAARYREAAEIVGRVWVDLGVLGLPLTSQYGHYFIALGAVIWAAGQYAAYAVFGHRRPLDAVITTGLLLLGNMALTRNDQLGLIVLFSLGALILLARSHALEEGSTWARRRIGDPASVTGLYLRGGALFISAAVVGSLFLTATASSAPLQGVWKGLPGTLVQVSQWLQRYVPLGGESRNPGVVVFGENAPLTGAWSQDSGIAFVARLPATETEGFHWRIGAYAEFKLTSWSWGETRTVERAAGEPLLSDSAEDPTLLEGRREVRVEITPDSLANDYIVSPQTILWVDQPAKARTTGSEDWFSTIEFDGAARYTVAALVPVIGDVPGGITANRLRVASREYTAEEKRLYLSVPAGSLGPESLKILDRVRSTSPDNPYDLALNLQNYLLSPANFRYDTDIQDEIQANCAGLSSVECFATIRAGYCQYYASTMAMLLRQAGVPTRFVQGFLKGERNADGTEIVRNSSAHAWVEVLFPGYGWVDFDPTGGGVGQPVALPSGAPASPTPRPSFGFVTNRPGDSGADAGPVRRTQGNGLPGSGGSIGTSAGPFIVIAILLLIGGAALASVAWRRGPRPMHPDQAWGSVARWAARIGLGPRPSQTVFEFAGTLGEAMPTVRPELATVARAKVEISYGRRKLGPERLRVVAEAHRRLRIGLIRLAFRRRGIRSGRRKGPKRGR
ncbi:MAG: transglutaminase domain-containing protein [Chloroflexi bacterium]|nr:transglutaminase domain-containing protein [Chloroflexota bacterium]